MKKIKSHIKEQKERGNDFDDESGSFSCRGESMSECFGAVI